MLPVLFFGAAFFAGVFFFADAVLLAFCAGRVDREEGVSLAASERVEAAWGRHMQRAFLLFFESFFLIFLFGPVDFFAAGFFFTDAFFFAAGLAFRAASGTSSSAEGAPHTAQHLHHKWSTLCCAGASLLDSIRAAWTLIYAASQSAGVSCSAG